MDAVDQTLNDMSMSPELLNQYSDHAKSITPGFANTSKDNGHGGSNRVQFRDEVDTFSGSYQNAPSKNLQDMSPEEQMMLMRKIQNSNQSDQYERPTEEHYETDTIKSTDNYEDQSLDQKNIDQKYIEPLTNDDNYFKLKIIIMILILFFIFNLHKVNFYLSKAILFITPNKNTYILSSIKSLIFTGILSIPIYLL